MSEDSEIVLRFLAAGYRDGARGEEGMYDCWGLVRQARTDLYGLPLLPEFAGELRFDPQEFTRRYQEQARKMRETAPKPGAIAAVMRGRLCVHVALITHDVTRASNDLYALEINPDICARWIHINEFERAHYGKLVKYYAD